MKHRSWIAISGFVWAAIGVMLLYKGLHFLKLLPDQKEATWWVAGGLLVGFVKGRFVLSKTVERMCRHILSLPLPIQIGSVYPKSYLILLSAMMGMGFILRFVPIEWRGAIDVAVGSALINGAMLYFRIARSLVITRS